jgi:OOP family OmpA-OmpF porin
VLVIILALGQPEAARAQQPAAEAGERVDYLTFAQGAMPVGIGGAGAKLGANFEAAVRAADGYRTGFSMISRAPGDADTEFVYELPALTTFARFAVGEVLETPSPTTTFTRLVEVHGSSTSATEGFVLLASATLQTHRARGLTTEVPVVAARPVRWVKLRLVGGINIMQEQSFIEFSEIIGNGTQEVPVMVTHFNGAWRTSALTLGLKQEGPVVSGCYETSGRLTGTVTGNILRATGVTPAGIPSAFILSVAADGSIRGVRSTNGGPFRLYTVAVDAKGTGGACAQPAPPALGCGSIVHGITFGYDSAEIRGDSEPILARLYEGLRNDSSAAIVIEGHTSSEGADAYNRQLSERRAQAVVANLVGRGLVKNRVSAIGAGESRPIAPNTDESGRSLNRRVEVRCK